MAQLVEGVKEKGKHRVEFDTTEVPAGVYYVRLTTDQTQILRKLTVTH
ncbi:MAG: T9SS type A sorting domain-containing protein [Chlorobi bacterium]|nr:T9SS type A sorting domain-containing protein [Chlorobiota bacterium]